MAPARGRVDDARRAPVALPGGRLRALRSFLVTGASLAPGLTLAFTVMVVIEALGPLLGAWSFARAIDAVVHRDAAAATGWAVGIAASIAIRMVALAVSTAPAVSTALEARLNDRTQMALHAQLLDLVASVPTLAVHEQPELADRLAVLRDRSRDMGYAAVSVAGTVATSPTRSRSSPCSWRYIRHWRSCRCWAPAGSGPPRSTAG